MEILEGSALSKLVDYSFGDQMALWNPGLVGEMKYANATNAEFINKAKEFEGKLMTLFIDNIRLYPRKIKSDVRDKEFVDYLMKTNNLLALCSLLPANGFIIFTGQEDTPIDSQILLPFNVLKVYAVNALYNNDKVIPFPFGVQRQMNPEDNRLEILKLYVEHDVKIEPTKLLYINCGVERNAERKPLKKFTDNDWTTTRFDKDSKFFPYERYTEYLDEIKNHKFVVCPKGHGFDTHRIWETLYLRRVPIIKDHPYFRKLMTPYPVLFVNNWGEITKQLLIANDNLYQEAQSMDLIKLDLLNLYNNCKIIGED